MLNKTSVITLFVSIFMLIGEQVAFIKGGFASMCQLLGLVVFVVLINRVYKSHNSFALSHVYQMIYFLGMLLSSFLLSFGVPMIEIGEVGTANGIFWLLMIYFIIGLNFANLGFRYGQKTFHLQSKARLNVNVEKTIISIMLVIPLIFSLLIVVRYGVPEGNADRVIYWSQVVPQNLAWINSAIKQVFFFVSLVVIFRMGKLHKSSKTLLAAYILITVYVLGEKASAFIILLSTFTFVYAAKKYLAINLKSMVAIFAIMGFVSFLIIDSYSESGYGVAFVFTRIALQAQVLWATLNTPSFPFYPAEDFRNIPNILTASDYFTFKFLPMYLYEIYNESGSTLSGFFPAFQIMYLGIWVSVAAHMAVSFVMGFVAGMSVTAIKVKSYLLSFLLFKIYFALIFATFALIFSAVLSFVFVASILLVVMFYILAGGVKFQVQHRVH